MSKHNEKNRFPGVDPIPEPDHESPSSTDMIEDILKEGSLEHKHAKDAAPPHSSSQDEDAE